MKEELINKIAARRYSFKNEKGEVYYRDIFGKVADYDKDVNVIIEENKGIKEYDNRPFKSYREVLNRYNDFKSKEGDPNPIKNDDDEDEFYSSFRSEQEIEIIFKGNDYSLLREDLILEWIEFRGICRYGYCNNKSHNKTECIYDDISLPSDGMIRVLKYYEVEGFVERRIDLGYGWMKDLTIEEMDYKGPGDLNCARYYKLKKYYDYSDKYFGFLDLEGNEVIECQYEEADDFHEGLAAVCTWNEWGYIDKENKMVIPDIFEWADSFVDGYARVMFAGRYYVIDKEGYCYESYEDLYYDNKVKFF